MYIYVSATSLGYALFNGNINVVVLWCFVGIENVGQQKMDHIRKNLRKVNGNAWKKFSPHYMIISQTMERIPK